MTEQPAHHSFDLELNEHEVLLLMDEALLADPDWKAFISFGGRSFYLQLAGIVLCVVIFAWSLNSAIESGGDAHKIVIPLAIGGCLWLVWTLQRRYQYRNESHRHKFLAVLLKGMPDALGGRRIAVRVDADGLTYTSLHEQRTMFWRSITQVRSFTRGITFESPRMTSRFLIPGAALARAGIDREAFERDVIALHAQGQWTDEDWVLNHLSLHTVACPKCGYDLSGHTTATCSECGLVLNPTSLPAAFPTL